MHWRFLSWCKEKSSVKLKKKELKLYKICIFYLKRNKSKFCALLKCYESIRRNDRNDRNLFGENHNLENWSLFMDIRFLVSHLLSGALLFSMVLFGLNSWWKHSLSSWCKNVYIKVSCRKKSYSFVKWQQTFYDLGHLTWL